MASRRNRVASARYPFPDAADLRETAYAAARRPLLAEAREAATLAGALWVKDAFARYGVERLSAMSNSQLRGLITEFRLDPPPDLPAVRGAAPEPAA